MFNAHNYFIEGDWFIKDILNEADYQLYLARERHAHDRFIWSPVLKRVYDLCLIHTSANVPGKVVYFATLQAMRDNKPTTTSPQMFLERWLINAPDFIRTAWEVEALGKILPTVEFIDNTNPEGWIDVYANGPYSCMQGKSVVQQYAHSGNNLALAFTRNKNGKIINRTIVNRKNKSYVRIFGESGAALSTALRIQGYHHDAETALEGELVHAAYVDCYSCDCVCIPGPYVDSDDMGVAIEKTVVTDTYEARLTSGAERFTSATNDDGDPICHECSS